MGYQEIAVATAAVVVGWLLNEVTRFLKSRAADKRKVGRVLADFLELRRRLIAFPRRYRSWLAEAGLSGPVMIQVQRYVQKKFLPDSESLRKRYHSALNQLSEVDPYLAYKLRSKDWGPKLINWFEAAIQQDEDARKEFSDFGSDMLEHAEESFDKVALRLARKHSPLTWWQVRRELNRDPEIPEDLEAYLDRARDLIERELEGKGDSEAQDSGSVEEGPRDDPETSDST